MDRNTEEEYYYKLSYLILSSCQHLRHVFKQRWKAIQSEDWVDDQNSMRNFLEGPGKSAFDKALPYQKDRLQKSCSPEDWDMTLLSFVILNFGGKKYWKQNDAIWKLKNVRNDLAHRGNKAISQSEYNEKVNVFKDCMSCLGMETIEIEKLIQRASVTSPLKAHEHVKVLFENAEKLLKDGKNDAALELYSEAISTPNLLPVNLGETFERRADCYLKSMKSLVVEDDYSDRAYLDVMKALELNGGSWTANYLAAKCYRIKNNTAKAIEYYERALSISPAQKQVHNDLETCRVLEGVQPKYADIRGRLIDEQLAKNYKLDDSVWRGHQYRFGIKVAQDYTKAVAFYTKADKQGNMEAAYHLAECCYFGHGVQQDAKKAFEIFKRVAEMKIKKHKGKKAFITGEAQYATGLCYENGTGVEMDLEKAAFWTFWYEKAMGNGVGRAANNLGILYSNGLKKDGITAEDCWKRGVDLEDGNSAECLVGYYCDQLEPEMAIKMFEVGRVLKSQRLVLLADEEFKRKIYLVKEERAKMTKMVTDFEKRNNLNSSGFTFKQRVNRATGSSESNQTETEKEAQVTKPTLAKSCENWEDNYQPLTGEMITELNKMHKDGSKEAFRILQLTVHNNELNYILENTKEFFKAMKLKLVNLLYECATTAFYFVVFKSDDERQKLEKIVKELFEDKKATYKKEDEMKIRYCYLRLNLWKSLKSAEDTFALEILKNGLQKHPDNQHYYELLITVFGYRQLRNEGIGYSDEALVKFPENAEIMYFRAVHLRSSNADPLAVIEAYTKFVNNAPPEHRKVPEAYFQISYGYMKQLEKCGDKDMLILIESHFLKGQEAEMAKLSCCCYRPFQESDSQVNVAQFLKKRLKKKLKQKEDLNATEQNKCQVEKMECLQSSTRRKHIKEHRKIINQLKAEDFDLKTDLFAKEPKLQQFLPKKMSLVKPITLGEMKCSKDTIFENRVIDLTVIDDPISLMTSIYLVVEDENKDTAPFYVNNIEVNQKNLEEFQAGCRIGLVNPYMWVDEETKRQGVRSDEPLSIVYLEKAENICRFCGKENASQRCSQCKRSYCSKECRDLDWKKFAHKLICQYMQN